LLTFYATAYVTAKDLQGVTVNAASNQFYGLHCFDVFYVFAELVWHVCFYQWTTYKIMKRLLPPALASSCFQILYTTNSFKERMFMQT